ncbi:MAG: hypothetical protein ABR562_07785, partial [Thermoplasmatota archaeon]
MAGADGIVVEVHPDPDVALCDGPQTLRLDDFGRFATRVEQAAAVAADVVRGDEDGAEEPRRAGREPQPLEEACGCDVGEHCQVGADDGREAQAGHGASPGGSVDRDAAPRPRAFGDDPGEER